MLEEVVERQNMRAAYQQVKRNAGAPGIDGMSVEELGPHLREEWQRIKEALLGERYEPQPVKRVEIPKPGRGVRQLGIPTVGGPVDPAGAAPGDEPGVRAGVLGIQLWVSPWAQRPRRGAEGA